MVGVNISDYFTPCPWSTEKIERALAEAKSSNYFHCDAVKFWHCDPARVLPIASKSYIRKVMVHATNAETVTVGCWKTWIEHNLAPIVASLRECDVFKEVFLAVGEEATDNRHAQRFGARLVPCLREVHDALKETGLADRVKLVTIFGMSILGSSCPPSTGRVSVAHGEVVTDVTRLLVKIGSPFCVNLYPFFSGYNNKDFLLFGSDPDLCYLDGGSLRYKSMFSAQYDAIISALGRLDVVGADQMDVVVAGTGWPTAGSGMADGASSRKFTAGVCAASVKGTPSRPGRIDVYLFELYDECEKPGAESEKHFGLFDIEGRPKDKKSTVRSSTKEKDKTKKK